MERRNGQSQACFDILPSICEYREFSSEEDYWRFTGTDSKQVKTRSASAFSSTPTSHQRDDSGEAQEEKQPLLTSYSRDSKVVGHGKWKPKPKLKLAKGRTVQKRRPCNNVQGEERKRKPVAKGWAMQKRKVKIAWAKSRGCRQSLRSGVKLVLSDCPLFLVKAIRDAYVSVMTRMANKCNERMWYLASARLL